MKESQHQASFGALAVKILPNFAGFAILERKCCCPGVAALPIA
jgi:hypothetical protein